MLRAPQGRARASAAKAPRLELRFRKSELLGLRFNVFQLPGLDGWFSRVELIELGFRFNRVKHPMRRLGFNRLGLEGLGLMFSRAQLPRLGSGIKG